jgi:hypothetical protein
MKPRFVEDGAQRLFRSPEFRKRLADLRASIHARYQTELAEAGFLRRCVLYWKMAADYRRERRKITPSPWSCYAKSR